MLTLCQVEQLARAGARTLFIGIEARYWAIRGEMLLHSNRVDRQQHRTRVGEPHENRLVSRHMTTGLDQGQSRKQFGITSDLPVA